MFDCLTGKGVDYKSLLKNGGTESKRLKAVVSYTL